MKYEYAILPKINWTYLALSWLIIFLIKYGILALFLKSS